MRVKENKDGTLVLYSQNEFKKLVMSDRIDGRNNSSETSDEDFAGSKSFEESLNLMRFGDNSSFKLLEKIKEDNKVNFISSTQKIHKHFNDVTGFSPVVPNAILGLPKSMINVKPITQKNKIIRIFYNFCAPWSVEASDLAKAGAKLLSYIDSLELQNYRVELNIGTVVMHGEKCIGNAITLKRADQPLNIKKLCFYVINPSFFRRIQFKWMETEENIPDMTMGYGSNNEDEKRKRFTSEILNNKYLYINLYNLEESEFTSDIDKIKEYFKI